MKSIKQIIILMTSLMVIFSGIAFYFCNSNQYSYANITNVPLTPGNLEFKAKLSTKKYDLALLKGFELDLLKPLNIKFYIDKMNQQALVNADKERLIKYFLAFLTISKNKLWVNLSPYEKERIIADPLADLGIGKDLLLADYLLKQIVTILTDPSSQPGEKFWKKIEAKAKELAHTGKLAVNNYYKVWIVPDIALVGEYKKDKLIALVKKAKLKVLIDDDYYLNKTMLDKRGISHKKAKVINDINAYSKKIFKEDLLPIIEDEVNNSINFSGLRQLYYAFILAEYFKGNFLGHPIYKYYLDQERISNLRVFSSDIVKNTVYQAYLKTFKDGVYGNKIRDRRHYFSGGASLKDKKIEREPIAKKDIETANLEKISGNFRPESLADLDFQQVYDLKNGEIVDLSRQTMTHVNSAEKYLFISSLINIFKNISGESELAKEVMQDIISMFIQKKPSIYIASGVKFGFCGLVPARDNENKKDLLILSKDYFTEVIPPVAKEISNVKISPVASSLEKNYQLKTNAGKYMIYDNYIYKRSSSGLKKDKELTQYLTKSKKYLRQIIYYIFRTSGEEGNGIIKRIEKYLLDKPNSSYRQRLERLAAQEKIPGLKRKHLKLIIDEFMNSEFNYGSYWKDTQEIKIFDSVAPKEKNLNEKFNTWKDNLLKGIKVIILRFKDTKFWLEWLEPIILFLLKEREEVKPEDAFIPNSLEEQLADDQGKSLLIQELIKKNRAIIQNQALSRSKHPVELGLRRVSYIDKDNILYDYCSVKSALAPNKAVIISFLSKIDFKRDSKLYRNMTYSLLPLGRKVEDSYFEFYDEKINMGMRFIAIPAGQSQFGKDLYDFSRRQLRLDMQDIAQETLDFMLETINLNYQNDSYKLEIEKLVKAFSRIFVFDFLSELYPNLSNGLAYDSKSVFILKALLKHSSNLWLNNIIELAHKSYSNFSSLFNKTKNIAQKAEEIINNGEFARYCQDIIDALPKKISEEEVEKYVKRILDIKLKIIFYEKKLQDNISLRNTQRKKERMLFLLYLAWQEDLTLTDKYKLLRQLGCGLGFSAKEIQYLTNLFSTDSVIQGYEKYPKTLLDFQAYSDNSLLDNLLNYNREYNKVCDLISQAIMVRILKLETFDIRKIFSAIKSYDSQYQNAILNWLAKNISTIVKKGNLRIGQKNNLVSFIKYLLEDRNNFSDQIDCQFFSRLLKSLQANIEMDNLGLLASISETQEYNIGQGSDSQSRHGGIDFGLDNNVHGMPVCQEGNAYHFDYLYPKEAFQAMTGLQFVVDN